MFKKISSSENKVECLGAFNSLNFFLAALLRFVEFIGLVWLVFGLGLFITKPFAASGLLGDVLSLALMIMILGALRVPLLYMRSALYADFGLDARSVVTRVKSILSRELYRGFIIWVGSCVVYVAMLNLNQINWLIFVSLLGMIWVGLVTLFPKIWSPEKLRPLKEGDLSPTTLARVDSWASKTGICSQRIVVSEAFSPFIQPPRIVGFGRTQLVVVPAMNLYIFPPREMALLLSTVILGAMFKAPLKIYFLHLCALALAISVSTIIINSAGVLLWGYPQTLGPVNIVALWFGGWACLNVAKFSTRLVQRSLEPQLAMAASVILKDEHSLVRAISIIAVRNLENEVTSGWMEVFQMRFGVKSFIRRAELQRHIAGLNDKQGEGYGK